MHHCKWTWMQRRITKCGYRTRSRCARVTSFELNALVQTYWDAKLCGAHNHQNYYHSYHFDEVVRKFACRVNAKVGSTQLSGGAQCSSHVSVKLEMQDIRVYVR